MFVRAALTFIKCP